jgi:glycosyltransferase involved in cell wall biosynthesis
MEGTCLQLADAVYSSSDCSADWCAREYGIRREEITILHTGVDTRLFRPLEIPKASRPTVIFVGKMTRTKGIDLLVEAACRLARRYPDLRVQMIGRGEEAHIESLRQVARTAGLPDLLDIKGFVEPQDLPAYLSAAHVFAGPSVYEGGPGFVYLEAMACGLPVVACLGSGATEVVMHEETGLLIPPGDLPALTDALDRLLADPKRCHAMGKRARQSVVMNADSNLCIRKLEAFYARVAGWQQNCAT